MMSALRTAVVAPLLAGGVFLAASGVACDDPSNDHELVQAPASQVVDVVSDEPTPLSYAERKRRINILKGEIYTCLYSLEYDQAFWDLLVSHERPRTSFRRLQEAYPEQIDQAFRNQTDLVYVRNGKYYLTPDALIAWMAIQAETVMEVMYSDPESVTAEFSKQKALLTA